MHSPSGKLARVVLHLSGENSTPLACQLGPPVQSTAGSLCLVVELVQGLDGQVLVLTVDVILNNSVELCPDNQVQRLVVLVQRQIESAVPVCLGRWRVGLDFLVVKGMLVGHVDLLGLGLGNDLEGEDVVDVRSLQHQGTWAVDGVLVALGNFERRVCGVLIDSNHVQT